MVVHKRVRGTNAKIKWDFSQGMGMDCELTVPRSKPGGILTEVISPLEIRAVSIFEGKVVPCVFKRRIEFQKTAREKTKGHQKDQIGRPDATIVRTIFLHGVRWVVQFRPDHALTYHNARVREK